MSSFTIQTVNNHLGLQVRALHSAKARGGLFGSGSTFEEKGEVETERGRLTYLSALSLSC